MKLNNTYLQPWQSNSNYKRKTWIPNCWKELRSLLSSRSDSLICTFDKDITTFFIRLETFLFLWKFHAFYSFLLKSLFLLKEDILENTKSPKNIKFIKNNFTIKIEERDIQLIKPFETILVLKPIRVWNINVV